MSSLPRREGELPAQYVARLNRHLAARRFVATVVIGFAAAVVVFTVFWVFSRKEVGFFCTEGVRCDGMGRCWCNEPH